MKLDVAVNEVVLSNVGITGEFKIRNSAKAFKILSDGLYSNKIRAIVRELSCNAVDSHVGAGKATTPFEVHLPTILEPWFAVRDFGMGLDGHQVVNIYTTYFESTKTDSNAFIGALGLGSKSPFSYTENFTVTAIKDGVQRIYSAFINEAGVPSIVEMGEQLTDEGNGVEVKFSVTDRNDYRSFANEARNVFTWFEHKPTITGVQGFEHNEFNYKEKNVVPGVHIMESGRSSFALMGNISYPMDNIPEVEKHFGNLSHLLGCNLVMEFQIGEIDFAASREQLSYIPLTLDSIRKKLELLNASLAGHLAKKANEIECKWERAQFLYEEATSRLYKAAVATYVADTKFPLYDDKAYYGKKTFEYLETDLKGRGLEISAFRTSSRGSERIGRHHKHVPGTGYVDTINIPVERDVVIVLNDLKTGCQARARYHYSRQHNRTSVYCVSHADEDIAVRQAEYDVLCKELHNPPVVVLASTLTKPERRPRVSTAGIASIGIKESKRAGYEDSYTWIPFTEEIDEDTTYYYVALRNHTPVDAHGKEFNMFSVRSQMDSCGIPGISNIRVLGVRKSRIKELETLDNWVWFEDKLREETAKITDNHVASLVATEMLDSYHNKVYTNANVAKMVGSDSDYAKYVDKYTKIRRATGNVTELTALCATYGKALHSELVKKSIEDAKTALYTKYPLLPHISSNAPEKMFADYIMMIDKLEKN